MARVAKTLLLMAVVAELLVLSVTKRSDVYSLLTTPPPPRVNITTLAQMPTISRSAQHSPSHAARRTTSSRPAGNDVQTIIVAEEPRDPI